MSEAKVALISEFGDGIGDRVVQTPVERSKLVDRNRHLVLERKLGDRLAKITVVVDDLVDRVPLPQQLGPVQGGTCADFGERGRPVGLSRDCSALERVGGLLDLQRPDELIQEKRNAVFEFGWSRLWGQAEGDLGAATVDKLVSAAGKKIVKHGR
jgi:hypothetical protein